MIIKKIYRKINSHVRMISNRGSSSVSDDGKYPKVVHSFVTDEKAFSNFRRNEIYMQIVECPTYKEGANYLEIVNRIWPEWRNYKHEFMQNDRIGNPNLYEYDGVGKVSAKLLQDILTMGEIRRVRPDIGTAKKIAEIGIGYGGLARLISSLYSPDIYYMYDLPDVLTLSKKYLSKLGGLESKIVANSAPVGG